MSKKFRFHQRHQDTWTRQRILFYKKIVNCNNSMTIWVRISFFIERYEIYSFKLDSNCNFIIWKTAFQTSWVSKCQLGQEDFCVLSVQVSLRLWFTYVMQWNLWLVELPEKAPNLWTIKNTWIKYDHKTNRCDL